MRRAALDLAAPEQDLGAAGEPVIATGGDEHPDVITGKRGADGVDIGALTVE